MELLEEVQYAEPRHESGNKLFIFPQGNIVRHTDLRKKNCKDFLAGPGTSKALQGRQVPVIIHFHCSIQTNFNISRTFLIQWLNNAQIPISLQHRSTKPLPFLTYRQKYIRTYTCSDGSKELLIPSVALSLFHPRQSTATYGLVTCSEQVTITVSDIARSSDVHAAH